MKIWFIRRNNDNLGPFSLAELKLNNLTKDDYVWKEGLPDWVQAKDLHEINELFSSKTPPPFTPQSNYSNINQAETPGIIPSTEKVGFRIGRLLGWSGILLIILITAVIIYNKNQVSAAYLSPYYEKSPEQLRAELVEQEKQNPSQYLIDQTTMRTNLIGEKVIEGTVTNSASVATFKDMILQVDFLSKTQSTITSRQFTIYEVLAPKESVKFKFKTSALSGTDGFAASIINAAPIN